MGMAQQVCGNKPWSVRMAESEMVRCPESWQLDFQTRLKWVKSLLTTIFPENSS